jgi:hypothetical protein
MRDGVGGFECGDDALDFSQRAEGRKSFIVGGVIAVDAARVTIGLTV